MDIEQQKLAAIAGIKYDHMKDLLKTATSYIATIFFGEKRKINTINNGTMFFVDLGGGILGITAAHVYRAFEKNKNESSICQLNNVAFNMKDFLIDINDELDIATFRIDSHILKHIRKKVFHLKWPPTYELKTNDAVFIAGYPKLHRLGNIKLNEVSFGISMFFMNVESVSDSNIAIIYDNEDVKIINLSVPPSDNNIGGISGAPVLLLNNDGVPCFTICGIIYEASPQYGVLFARHPRNIMPNGEIIFSEHLI